MPRGICVRLPADYNPRFPEECVICGQSDPDSALRISTSEGILSRFLHRIRGAGTSSDVPACDSCRRRFGFHGWLRSLTLSILGILCLMGARYVLSDYQGPFKIWLVILLGIGFMTPIKFLELLFPITIELSRRSGYLCYDFQNRPYAISFIARNVGAVMQADPDFAKDLGEVIRKLEPEE